MGPMSRAPSVAPAERLPADQRRESLLDVARELVVRGGPDAVTMGTVAERAEVTRALVYKHFENRGAILAALYKRAATALDRSIRRHVLDAPEGFEHKLRALVHATVAAVGSHGDLFPGLRTYGNDAGFRRERGAWDRRTAAYFAELAAAELGIYPAVARPAVTIVLGGIEPVVTQVQSERDPERHALIEELFVDMGVASLQRLAERFPP